MSVFKIIFEKVVTILVRISKMKFVENGAECWSLLNTDFLQIFAQICNPQIILNIFVRSAALLGFFCLNILSYEKFSTNFLS